MKLFGERGRVKEEAREISWVEAEISKETSAILERKREKETDRGDERKEERDRRTGTTTRRKISC